MRTRTRTRALILFSNRQKKIPCKFFPKVRPLVLSLQANTHTVPGDLHNGRVLPVCAHQEGS